MENKFIIVYDLNGANKNYEELIDRLNRFPVCLKINKSAFCIRTSLSAVSVRDELVKYLDKDDSILVEEITGEGAWRNIECGNESFKAKF